MKEVRLTGARQKQIERALCKVPFAELLGIEFEKIQHGVATLSFEVTDRLRQNLGVVHGGAIASLIDTAAAFAIISALPAREKATTVDLTVHYLRPLTQGRARATARIVRAGKRLIVVSAEVHDTSGRQLATALTTYIKL